MGYFNPFFYNDSPLPMEQILWLFKWIKDHEATIDSFDDVRKEIEQTLAHFDETVVEKVTEAIQQMYDDGTLSDIIIKYLDSDIAKTEILDFRHQYRAIQFTGYNWERYSGTGYSDGFSNCQGGCQFMYNGVRYFAEMLHDKDGNGKLKVYSETNATNPVYTFDIASKHSQSVTYNPADHCLYVPIFTDQYSSTADSGIAQCNLDTVDAPIVHQVASDSSAVAWWSVKAVEEADGWKLYGFKNLGIKNGKNECDMYLIDFANSTSTKVDTVRLPALQGDSSKGGYNQFINANCCVNKDYIAVLTWRPSSVMLFTRTRSGAQIDVDRDPYYTYQIPRVLDGCYAQGEVEDISLDDKLNLQLVTQCDLNGTNEPSTMTNALTIVVRHYITNLAKGNVYASANRVNECNPVSILVNRSDRNYQFFVDWSSQWSNPLGTSDQPFKTVQEAVEVIRNCPDISSCNIRLKSNDYLPAFITTGKPISISLQNNTLYGLYLGLSNVYLKGGHIAQSCNASNFGNDNAPIYAWGNTLLGVDNVVSYKTGTAGTQVACTHDAYIGYGLIYYGRFTTSSGSLNLSGYASASVQHNL